MEELIRERAAHLRDLESRLQDLQNEIDEAMQEGNICVGSRDGEIAVTAKYQELKASNKLMNRMLLELSDIYDQMAKLIENDALSNHELSKALR